MRIVVIGGTGLIGSTLVDTLSARGHDAVAASPRTGVDTVTGKGLSEVLAGCSVVVDASDAPSSDGAVAHEFFDSSTTHLLRAETAAGVGHHIALSVVGTDRLATQGGYFRAKLRQEQLIESGPVPYSIVRATQFFEFLRRTADAATVGTTVRLPPVLIQPIAAVDVADALADTALGEPHHGVSEVCGPDRFRVAELIRTALTARGDAREVIEDPTARCWGIKLAEDTLLPSDGARLFDTHVADWILAQAAGR